MNLDGSAVEALFDTSLQLWNRGLAYDTQSETLFLASDFPVAGIIRLNTDGTGQQEIATPTSNYQLMLSVDGSPGAIDLGDGARRDPGGSARLP